MVFKNLLNLSLQKTYNFMVEKAYKQIRNQIMPKTRLDTEKLGLNLNLSMFLNPSDRGISSELYAFKFREPINTYVMFNFLKSHEQLFDACLDVGSNIGYFVKFECAAKIKRVIAVEPVPETFKFLQLNKEYAEILNVAVSDKSGVGKIYVPAKRNLASFFKFSASLESSIKYVSVIKFLTLNEVIENLELKTSDVILRMDLEGYEAKLIPKLPKQITALIFELHPHILGFSQTKNLIRNLQKQNFKIQKILLDYKGVAPIVKILGLQKYLKIRRKLIISNPSQKTLNWLASTKTVCPHVYAVRRIKPKMER